ncbi:MAG: hypothetical protein VYA84_08285 [Planctomycetota bacterium]|nr:hypothetical protein [Planctomycetota bacterium]
MIAQISCTITAFLLIFSLAGCAPTDSQTDQSASNAASSIDTTSVVFANTKCPMMGGKPTAELTAEYNGQTIGFCCDGCPQGWAKLTDEEKEEKFTLVSVAANGDHDHGDHDHGDHDHGDHDHGDHDHGDHDHGDHDHGDHDHGEATAQDTPAEQSEATAPTE